MRVPIKVSLGKIPKWLSAIVPAKANPGALVLPDRAAFSATPDNSRAWFSLHVSGLTSDVTWKATRPGRHRLVDEAVLGLVEKSGLAVLDAGASDGVTSLELIERLRERLSVYYVTDRRVSVRFIDHEGALYFYDDQGRCFLRSTTMLIAYLSEGGWWPLAWLSRRLLSQAPEFCLSSTQELALVQPELRRMAASDPRVKIRDYDVFSNWDGPSLDVIRAANLLNLDYFPKERICCALANLGRALKPGGRLVVAHDSAAGTVRASVCLRTGDRLVIEHTINGGSEIDAIVEGVVM